MTKAAPQNQTETGAMRRTRRSGGMRRRIATACAVLIVMSLAYHVVFGRNGVNNYEQKRAQDRELRQQINVLQRENGNLKDHVSRLKSDPDAIEYEAREKLHYARPGEVIYKLNQPQAPTDGASSHPGGKSE